MKKIPRPYWDFHGEKIFVHTDGDDFAMEVFSIEEAEKLIEDLNAGRKTFKSLNSK